MNHNDLRTMMNEYLSTSTALDFAGEPDVNGLVFDLNGMLPEGFPANGKSWAYDCTVRAFSEQQPDPAAEVVLWDEDDEDGDDIITEPSSKEIAGWCLRLEKSMFDYLLAFFIDKKGLAKSIQDIISASRQDGFVTIHGERIDYYYHNLKSVAKTANTSRREMMEMAETAGFPCNIPEFVPETPEWIEILNAKSNCEF